jgi:hypothetical protein
MDIDMYGKNKKKKLEPGTITRRRSTEVLQNRSGVIIYIAAYLIPFREARERLVINMSNKYSGTCLCESVKFSIGDTKAKFICYCIDCRKSSGHLGQLLAKIDTENLSIEDPTEQLKEYTITQNFKWLSQEEGFLQHLWMYTHDPAYEI